MERVYSYNPGARMGQHSLGPWIYEATLDGWLLGGMLYFKAHACLAAPMSILRRNLNTTCITTKPWHDITAVGPISGGYCWTWRLSKQAFSKKLW